MLFVDGENLTIRCQRQLEEWRFEIPEGNNFKRDSFIWFPGLLPREVVESFEISPDQSVLVRASYYASLVGDADCIQDARHKLRNLGFDGHVFKKDRRDVKAKGVDVALTKDVLSHAFFGNYDVAVLIAGDGDFVPLVEEVKRFGKQVFLAFISNGLSPELRLVCDEFRDLTATLNGRWLAAIKTANDSRGKESTAGTAR